MKHKPPFHIALFNSSYDRNSFDCGAEPLNRYLRKLVSQDVRRRVASCFVALTDEQQIAGYYTLASTGIPLTDLPPQDAKKLPRYPLIPAIRLGRLAVDKSFKGQGLGAALLADAISRAIQTEIAAYAIIVDAKDDTAAAFYSHHGFIAFPDTPLVLFLPLSVMQNMT